jgi:tetratricopeptide (TPR) repeat protein
MNSLTKPPKARRAAAEIPRARAGVRRIAIGGRLLEDMLVREDSELPGGLAYRAFPGKEHAVVEDAQGVTVSLPTLSALQLYHEGVLPVDRAQPVELTVGRRRIGPLFVHWLRAQRSVHSVNEHVRLRLGREPSVAKPDEPPPWLRNESAGLDSLEPLRLQARGKAGRRILWEMERVLPGKGLTTLARAYEHADAGRRQRAQPMLQRLVRADGRCLEARALVGYMAFRNAGSVAWTSYEQAVLIGRRALGEGFDGLLPWDFEGNRAFLRSLYGLALCLWRDKRFEEAEEVLRELQDLDPADPLRAGDVLALVSRDVPYEPRFVPAR